MRTNILWMTGLILATTAPLMARDTTAFELMKSGNQYVGIQSKDKVVQIRSEKSIATMTPNVWHVDYYDPSTGSKYLEVTFSAGQETDISHPWHPFQRSYHESDVLDRSKLRVDSDAALRTATSQGILKHLTLKASQMTLDHGDLGPVWKIRLWAAKLNSPDKEVDIGVITLTASDGSVVRSDLHPERVD